MSENTLVAGSQPRLPIIRDVRRYDLCSTGAMCNPYGDWVKYSDYKLLLDAIKGTRRERFRNRGPKFNRQLMKSLIQQGLSRREVAQRMNCKVRTVAMVKTLMKRGDL